MIAPSYKKIRADYPPVPDTGNDCHSIQDTGNDFHSVPDTGNDFPSPLGMPVPVPLSIFRHVEVRQ